MSIKYNKHSLIFILVVCFILTSCSGSGDAARFARQAEQFARDGQYAEAALTYRQALITDPENPDLLYSLGTVLSAQGRDRSAALVLDRAVSLRPEDKNIRDTLDGLESEPQNGLSLELVWISSIVSAEPVGASISSRGIFIVYSDGQLLALDQDSGQVLWKISTPEKFISPPAASAEQVWVGAEDGTIYVFDASSGNRLGAFETSGPVYAAPGLTSKTAYCPSNDGWLYAVDLNSMYLIWKAETSDSLHVSPLINRQTVYVGSNDGRVYAFDAATGERTWAYGILTQGAVESLPIFAEDRILVGSGDGRVYALEAQTGGEYWRYSTPDAVFASPIVVEDQVIIASSGQILASVNLLDGTEKWSLPIDHPITETPALFKGQLYLVPRGDPHLIAVDPESGEMIGTLNTGDWITFGPLVSGKDLILVGKDGSVMLFR